jgi:hypothetical protein
LTLTARDGITSLTFFADLISLFREYFLMIWLEIVDFKPMCLIFSVEINSDVGNSLENSEKVENEDETEGERE